ncbi:hypothetical protein C8R45DRAFT_947983 [Mycena sanguinolenta]|nr:hypothetical protein C8R45DRAFT_947983 [Mycena sanguinolenta]
MSCVRKATDMCWTAHYSSETSTMGYYHQPMTAVRRMVKRPDSYIFKNQLMLNMPPARDGGENAGKNHNKIQNAGPPPAIEDPVLEAIRNRYKSDSFFTKTVVNPKDLAGFRMKKGLIYCQNRGKEEVLCIPDIKLGEQSLRGVLLEQSHRCLGHFGPQRTGDYIRR